MFQSMIGNGAIAQLGERLHGMQEVSGSIPLGSTKKSQNILLSDFSDLKKSFRLLFHIPTNSSDQCMPDSL